MSANIEAIKKAIGIEKFNRLDLLQIALTHSSYIYENPNLNRQQQDLQEREYRRFAILGDSILGTVVILAFARNFDPSSGTSKARQFALSFNRANKIALDTAFINNSKFDPANVFISAFTLDFEPELRQALQQLQTELPEPDKERERFEEWRQANGQAWVEKIRNILGHDLQFSKAQKKLLQDYYDANKLLVECLNKANDLPPEARENIEASLFLPKELIG